MGRMGTIRALGVAPRGPSQAPTVAIGAPGPSTASLVARAHEPGVNYWRLNFYLRAQLECRIFGAVWAWIWLILGGFRPPGAVVTDIWADATVIRR